MNEDRFNELVDLCLDQEVSARELAELKSELADNPQRRGLFQERYRLHCALRLALRSSLSDPQTARERLSITAADLDGLSPSVSTAELLLSSRSLQRSSSRLRWVPCFAVAASLVILLTIGALLFNVVDERTNWSGFEMAGFGAPVEGEAHVRGGAQSQWEDLEADGRGGLRRYAVQRQRPASHERSSLAAELRLMGLQPELIPEDKRLIAVDRAALELRPSISPAERLQRASRMVAMPPPRILRLEVEGDTVGSGLFSGFHSSLATF